MIKTTLSPVVDIIHYFYHTSIRLNDQIQIVAKAKIEKVGK